MKPLEFVIDDENKMRFFYADGSVQIIQLPTEDGLDEGIPKGIVRHRHYHIDDMYGNAVIDDRKGL